MGVFPLIRNHTPRAGGFTRFCLAKIRTNRQRLSLFALPCVQETVLQSANRHNPPNGHLRDVPEKSGSVTCPGGRPGCCTSPSLFQKAYCGVPGKCLIACVNSGAVSCARSKCFWNAGSSISGTHARIILRFNTQRSE